VTQLDPDGVAACFTDDAVVRLPRREGDLVIADRPGLLSAATDLGAVLDRPTWTPSRRLVTPCEVTEEAVLGVGTTRPRTGPRSAHGSPATGSRRLHIPLRVIAGTGPDGLIRELTLWLDWAALRAPDAPSTVAAVTSALVAAARAHDDRGLQVLRSETRSLIEPTPPTAPHRYPVPGRDRPVGAGAIWWQTHRRTLAGSIMALTSVLLLGWVAVTVPGSVPGTAPERGAALDPGGSGGSTSSDGGSTQELHAAAAVDGPPGTVAVEAVPDAEGSPAAAGPLAAAPAPATAHRSVPTGAPVLPADDPDDTGARTGREITFLSDVLFEFGSFELSGRARTRLGRLADQVRRAEVTGDIQVSGFTDSIGDPRGNLRLSRARARAVAVALSNRLDGVDVRLRFRGLGETHPRDTNRTADGRRNNRRVTVVLPRPAGS